MSKIMRVTFKDGRPEEEHTIAAFRIPKGAAELWRRTVETWAISVPRSARALSLKSDSTTYRVKKTTYARMEAVRKHRYCKQHRCGQNPGRGSLWMYNGR